MGTCGICSASSGPRRPRTGLTPTRAATVLAVTAADTAACCRPAEHTLRSPPQDPVDWPSSPPWTEYSSGDKGMCPLGGGVHRPEGPRVPASRLHSRHAHHWAGSSHPVTAEGSFHAQLERSPSGKQPRRPKPEAISSPHPSTTSAPQFWDSPPSPRPPHGLCLGFPSSLGLLTSRDLVRSSYPCLRSPDVRAMAYGDLEQSLTFTEPSSQYCACIRALTAFTTSLGRSYY